MTVQGWVPLLIDGLEPDPSRYVTYVGGYSILYPVSLRRVRKFSDWVPWISADRFKEEKACRLCLKEGPEPYRRLSWRMAWMTSCPVHGVLLEDIFVKSGRCCAAVKPPEPAPPEILAMDLMTLQAVKDGKVSLPRRDVHGGVWVRLLRALIDELSLPKTSINQYVKNVVRIWNSLDLSVRQGLSATGVPFEMMAPQRQFLLMRAAGVAIDMLMKGSFNKAGDDAFLFRPLAINDEDLLSIKPRGKLVPTKQRGKKVQEEERRSAYERAWADVRVAMKKLEISMRHNRKTVLEVRNYLLGANPTPDKIEKIDRMFREHGYFSLNDESK